MFKYRIGHATCEEPDFWEAEHEEHFSEKDLTKMIAGIIAEIIRKNPADHTQRYNRSFQCFFRAVIEGLKDRGFRGIDYDEVWTALGWGDVTDPEDWPKDKDGLDYDLCEEINKLLKSEPGKSHEKA